MYESGYLRVEPPVRAAPPGSDAERALTRSIEAVDAAWRAELAFEAPALVMPVAIWGAEIVHRACQALVYREMQPQGVTEALSLPCPRHPSPEVCYSADLALRVLPQLLALARAASP